MFLVFFATTIILQQRFIIHYRVFKMILQDKEAKNESLKINQRTQPHELLCLSSEITEGNCRLNQFT